MRYCMSLTLSALVIQEMIWVALIIVFSMSGDAIFDNRSLIDSTIISKDNQSHEPHSAHMITVRRDDKQSAIRKCSESAATFEISSLDGFTIKDVPSRMLHQGSIGLIEHSD